MFTGLVEGLGRVVSILDEPPGKRLAIESSVFTERAELGASIAVNGCCLTVVEIAGNVRSFEAGPETLALTNLGGLAVGSAVNLERSMRLGDAIGGHLVSGHIDGLGKLVGREDTGEWSHFTIEFPPHLGGQIAAKGSVAVDGVSLTVVSVDARSFRLMLIPHTLQVTTLGSYRDGQAVNLETDLLAKYVERQLAFGR